MKTGMLWQIVGGSPLEEEIKIAAEYYRQKYGKVADTVEMHPSTLEGQDISCPNGMSIHTAPNIQPGILWIGAERG